MRLAAYAIERARYARILIYDFKRSHDSPWKSGEELHKEEQAESKAYTDKKCALEELIDRAGNGNMTFISKAGSGATLYEESLEYFLTKAGISRSWRGKTE
jgi:hypothetical protein